MSRNVVEVPKRSKLRGRILLVDDDEVFREALAAALCVEGFAVRACLSASEALIDIGVAPRPYDVALVDLRMPGMDGMAFLREMRRNDPSLHIIMVTAYGDVQTAVEAMRAGAADFLQKPVSTEFLTAKLDRICEIRKAHLSRRREGQIVGDGRPMRQLMSDARRVATAPSGVLIVGETGVGKELLAKFIHRHSGRKGSFVAVNMSAIPRDLISPELFGYKKGAFTGAVSDRRGLFEAAQGGTLFLDEIGDMPLEQQPHLLRTLQEKRIRPVGGAEEIPVDVRILAATSLDIEKAIADGRLRQDLFYRLCVVQLRIPPLRERKVDIPALASYFLAQIRRQVPDAPESLSDDLLGELTKHDWPGNVRELQNVIMGMAVSSTEPELTVANLPHDFAAVAVRSGRALLDPRRLVDLEGRMSLAEIVDRVEREIVTWAMLTTGGNRSHAAELLRIPRTTLNEKLKKKVGCPSVGRHSDGNPSLKV